MTSILEGVVKRGTGKKLKVLNVPLAGKTGTTNKNFDAWFIGFTSDLAIGVYVGYDEPRSLGKYETGSKAALPIFKNFVTKAIIKKAEEHLSLIGENNYLKQELSSNTLCIQNEIIAASPQMKKILCLMVEMVVHLTMPLKLQQCLKHTMMKLIVIHH